MGDNLLKVNGVVDESPENMEAAAATIRDWLQDAWDAIRSDDGFNSKGNYYTEYIDIQSFAKMYLMHEYVKSYDVCAGSILFHRDGQSDSDKLIAGPIWDLDNAMGSVYQNSSLGEADDQRNGDRRSGEGTFIANVKEYKTSIYKTLGKHADFMQEVYRQYNYYHDKFQNLPDDLTDMISEIEASAKMNHQKVKDLTNNIHRYRSQTTLGSGQYQQVYEATTNSRTDWPIYAENLKTYITCRSLWFSNTYYGQEYEVAVTGLRLNPTSLELPAGKSGTIEAEILPAYATNQEIEWTCSDTKLATVDEHGRITAKSMGKVTITAVTKDGGYQATCSVRVLFSDVTNPKLAAYDAIYWGADRGFVNGYGSYFDINGKCTRGQFILFL